jgi:hypothetical protein
MTKWIAVGIALSLAPSLQAADKTRTCRALTEDGATTIVEQTYEGAKYLECVAAVKAKVVETKCTPGAKRFKFMMQREDAKPYAYSVECGAGAAAAPAASGEPLLLGSGDKRCKALSEDGSSTLVTAAYKLGDYDNCLKLVKEHLAKTQCTAGVKRFKYQMQKDAEKAYPSAITCP